jgi:putative SOS response-associated peptidase YedK
MCGRYTLRVAPGELAELFDVITSIDWAPRYNIAPTQTVAAVRANRDGKGRELALLKWGLIPSWAKDAKIGSSLINARTETVAEKPAFRSAFRKKRCLIAVDGFYEWQAIAGQKTKQPYFIAVKDVPVFAFAGLAEHWTSPEGTPVDTCTIITTSANSLMQPIHNRMPVIVDPDDYDAWLDPDRQAPQEVLPILKQFPAGRMRAVAAVRRADRVAASWRPVGCDELF